MDASEIKADRIYWARRHSEDQPRLVKALSADPADRDLWMCEWVGLLDFCYTSEFIKPANLWDRLRFRFSSPITFD